MFTLIAKITINEDSVNFVKGKLKELIIPSRQKDGCFSYKMYEDKKEENIVFFIEKWESSEVFSKHMKSDLIVNYAKETEGMVKKIELNKIQEIQD